MKRKIYLLSAIIATTLIGLVLFYYRYEIFFPADFPVVSENHYRNDKMYTSHAYYVCVNVYSGARIYRYDGCFPDVCFSVHYDQNGNFIELQNTHAQVGPWKPLSELFKNQVRNCQLTTYGYFKGKVKSAYSPN